MQVLIIEKCLNGGEPDVRPVQIIGMGSCIPIWMEQYVHSRSKVYWTAKDSRVLQSAIFGSPTKIEWSGRAHTRLALHSHRGIWDPICGLCHKGLIDVGSTCIPMVITFTNVGLHICIWSCFLGLRPHSHGRFQCGKHAYSTPKLRTEIRIG